ncbi:hypothetical protein AYI68_g6612 [Smittium mucronatum]|uniref:CUE domain-containing protein n=1 Tax=Smittium mucronatum TaxID=133383 RepID=A0A1R0GQZ7_9FUNG|nr:hypothetical protein AYI68_g6612 [Smittium mucronatum]
MVEDLRRQYPSIKISRIQQIAKECMAQHGLADTLAAGLEIERQLADIVETQKRVLGPEFVGNRVEKRSGSGAKKIDLGDGNRWTTAQREVSVLCEMFPQMGISEIKSSYHSCGGSVEKTANRLYQLAEKSKLGVKNKAAGGGGNKGGKSQTVQHISNESDDYRWISDEDEDDGELVFVLKTKPKGSRAEPKPPEACPKPASEPAPGPEQQKRNESKTILKDTIKLSVVSDMFPEIDTNLLLDACKKFPNTDQVVEYIIKNIEVYANYKARPQPAKKPQPKKKEWSRIDANIVTKSSESVPVAKKHDESSGTIVIGGKDIANKPLISPMMHTSNKFQSVDLSDADIADARNYVHHNICAIDYEFCKHNHDSYLRKRNYFYEKASSSFKGRNKKGMSSGISSYYAEEARHFNLYFFLKHGTLA